MSIHDRQTNFVFEAAYSTNTLAGPVGGKAIGTRHLKAGRDLSHHLLQALVLQMV